MDERRGMFLLHISQGNVVEFSRHGMGPWCTSVHDTKDFCHERDYKMYVSEAQRWRVIKERFALNSVCFQW